KIKLLSTISGFVSKDNLWIQPSSSLLHVPVTTDNETLLPSEIKKAMAFADQKLEEISILTKGLNEGINSVRVQLDAQQSALTKLANSETRNNLVVQKQAEAAQSRSYSRHLPFKERYQKQQEIFKLPLLPTTTIGSFPQTAEVKKARSHFKRNEWTASEYESFINEEIKNWIQIQEDIGLDVFVHGEFERTDMVEYFGERLGGFVFLKNGWVQSYGSRCVKPPVISGDVDFLEPMTVRESVYAQQLTDKP
ncbi:5-methyltetrahydropteroyltriglutamate--homocysteine S-methyltransferase, partial [Peribacillus psychrosaccharolyticus]